MKFLEHLKDTKEKILEAAVQLFNERGVSQVTLRDIAQEAGISPGNLAYHFRNQDFIIEALFRQMEQERDEILMGVQQIPSFENVDRQIGPLMEVAQKYRFFHLDAVYIHRTYPAIATLQQEYFKRSIQYVKAVISLSVGMGNYKPETEPGQFERLAQIVWMLMTFWLEQQVLRGEEGQDAAQLRRCFWDLVIPHLTEKGRHLLQKIVQPDHASLELKN